MPNRWRHPRYVYVPGRIFRPVRRPVEWRQPFGYGCTDASQLILSGQQVHNFQSVPECEQAIQDIYDTTDFCDAEDLFDQNGEQIAQFNDNNECREALGYYY